MSQKETLGFITIVLTVLQFIPYFRDVFRRKTKPHLFTWFLWGLMSSIGFAAQWSDNAGPGAWAMGLSAVAVIVVATLAFKQGEKKITRGDWLAFIGALLTIPLWYLTNNPLYAVLLIVAIHTLAYYPTFRKAWAKPQEETALSYALAAIKFALSLFALENVTLVTALYPAFLAVSHSLFVALLLGRRSRIASAERQER